MKHATTTNRVAHLLLTAGALPVVLIAACKSDSQVFPGGSGGSGAAAGGTGGSGAATAGTGGSGAAAGGTGGSGAATAGTGGSGAAAGGTGGSGGATGGSGGSAAAGGTAGAGGSAGHPDGAPCAGGSECESGFCADGVCCDGACTSACDVCTLALGATADGACSPAPFGTTGSPSCLGNLVCDGVGSSCVLPCNASQNNKRSVGCEYHPVRMDAYLGTIDCFAAFVVNNWATAASLGVSYQSTVLDVPTFTRIPSGAGPSLSYQPYDGGTGLPPGDVAIVFLAGTDCPAPAAVPNGVELTNQTGIGSAFTLTSNVPVAAYQMYPYGGGSSATTGAALLLPVAAWGDNYLLMTAQDADINLNPSLNIVAHEDGTTVTLRPAAAVVGGGGIPAAAQNALVSVVLDAGEHAQLTQSAQLAGSIMRADKPVGVMAGHRCMRAPLGTGWCDHAEQMLPPIRALGSEYVAVMHRPRAGEPGIWRLVGVVSGTQLSYSSDVGGPASLAQGQIVDVVTDTPFVVQSQDAAHPFMLFNLMSGSQWPLLVDDGGYGDPDFVISVPPQQYLRGQVHFFADPTYPETNLVVVRGKLGDQFENVELDCLGNLGGWQPLGVYEWTRVDLTTGDFEDVGSCSTGRRSIDSAGPYGLWVWGWGTPLTTTFTNNVSYGYPAAMTVSDINGVSIVP